MVFTNKGPSIEGPLFIGGNIMKKILMILALVIVLGFATYSLFFIGDINLYTP
jgi:hypothetical protein